MHSSDGQGGGGYGESNGGDLALADFKGQDKYRAKKKQVLSGGWGGEVALDSQRYNLIDLHIP